MQTKLWLGSFVGSVALLAVMALLAGCTEHTGESAGNVSNLNGAPEVRLAVLSPTPEAVLDSIQVETTAGQGGYDVTLTAIEEISGSELFLALGYDAAGLQATELNPVSANDDPGLLGLALEADAGRIEYGIVSTNQATDSVAAPGDILLSMKLSEGSVDREASDVSENNSSRARNLELNEAGGNWQLSWDYTNPGDCNQDGEVGIQDLTPIGQHYMEQVENTWDDPRRHIDGDQNGEINLGDITSIGMNFAAELLAYHIQMSADGESSFGTVGVLKLDDIEMPPGETIRFTYDFVGQYVENAWYRVVPYDSEGNEGVPSDANSQNGRRVDPVEVDTGGTVTVTLFAQDLEFPIQHMNSARVVFPEGYEYVPGSFNPGTPTGLSSTTDGIWSTFATNLLIAPENLLVTQDAGPGLKSIDFNVTSVSRDLPGAPVGYGDLFSFQLKNVGGSDLTLDTVAVTEDGIERTYYTDSNANLHFFGNKVGFRIQ